MVLPGSLPAGGRCLPADGDQRASSVAGRERSTEAGGRRSDARSTHPSGSRRKKDLTTSKRRDIARWVRDCFQLSVRRSCSLIRLRNATWYYRWQARDSSALRQRLRELATARPRFGYARLNILLVRERWRVGRNRVHRLYKLEGLQVRMRVRRRKRIMRTTTMSITDRDCIGSVVTSRFRAIWRQERTMSSRDREPTPIDTSRTWLPASQSGLAYCAAEANVVWIRELKTTQRAFNVRNSRLSQEHVLLFERK